MYARRGETIERTSFLPNYIPYVIATTLLVITVLASLNIGGSTQNVLSMMQIWPKPETVSELYFTKSNSLPATFIPNSNLDIEFTVRNLELQDVSYDYKIEQLNPANNQTAVLGTGALSLSHSKEAKEKISVVPANIKGMSKISVTITYPSKTDIKDKKRLTISYWLKNSKEV
jgi:hypothetical protein